MRKAHDADPDGTGQGTASGDSACVLGLGERLVSFATCSPRFRWAPPSKPWQPETKTPSSCGSRCCTTRINSQSGVQRIGRPTRCEEATFLIAHTRFTNGSRPIMSWLWSWMEASSLSSAGLVDRWKWQLATTGRACIGGRFRYNVRFKGNELACLLKSACASWSWMTKKRRVMSFQRQFGLQVMKLWAQSEMGWKPRHAPGNCGPTWW